jgi:hypothetical protein
LWRSSWPPAFDFNNSVEAALSNLYYPAAERGFDKSAKNFATQTVITAGANVLKVVSLSARNDLISNTLTPGVPTSIVIKLVGSKTPAGTLASCNASTVGTTGNTRAPGLAAWGTTIHALPVTPGSPATTYGVTETKFANATLSDAELDRITILCGFIQTNGSGFGICKSCRFGGLGDVQQ